MKKVIVTGANGFLGSELVRRLAREEVRVIAVDAGFSPCHLPESDLITRVEISIRETGNLTDAIAEREFDAFYHFAWAGVNGKQKADADVQSENIRMTLQCASAAKELQCKRFLCAGTVAERAVDLLPRLAHTGGGMMYATAKHSAHLMLETWCKYIGQPFVWMQFANIYGPQNHTGNLVSYTLTQLQRGEEATYGPALQPYDFIFVDDVIEAVVRMGDAALSRNCYYVGSGAPRRLKDYLLEIGRMAGREELIRIGARPDDGITYEMEMFDIASLTAEIGAYNQTAFAAGIARTIREYTA